MKSKTLAIATWIFTSCTCSWALATDCQAPFNKKDGNRPYQMERDGLQWCDSNSSGNNEGAQCGYKALVGTDPGDLGGIALSNTWSRTNMMGAAKAAYKNGAKEKAIDAAICCQIHNPHMHTCMKKNRLAVGKWLQEH
jgi:hypothetical protein